MDNLILVEAIAETRATYRLKLPDATVAPTALYKSAILVTNDQDFRKVSTLKIINY
jgi:predicted nucleic acid-binding protein